MVSWGYSLVVCRLLLALSSLVAEHRLQGMRVSVVVAHGLSSCGSWALVVVHRGLVFAIKYGTSCNWTIQRIWEPKGAGQLTQIGKKREAFLEEILSPQKFSKDKGWLDWQGPNRE